MELRSYISAHHKQLLVGASSAVAVSGLVVAGTGLGDGGGSEAIGATRRQAAAATTITGVAPHESSAGHAANPPFGTALTTAGRALGTALRAAINDAVADPTVTAPTGRSGSSKSDGVERGSAVKTPAVPNSVTVSVTPPSYTPGKRSPSVTPPTTSGGSAPSVARDDSSVSVYFGSAPTVNPPAVDTGERGRFNPPDAQVSTE